MPDANELNTEPSQQVLSVEYLADLIAAKKAELKAAGLLEPRPLYPRMLCGWCGVVMREGYEPYTLSGCDDPECRKARAL